MTQEEHDMFADISNSPLFQKKVLDNKYAQNLYAAICQNEFQKTTVFNILRDDKFTASWRGAGRFIAELRGIGEDYMDFYCSGVAASGMRENMNTAEVDASDQVPEGYITPEIMADLESIKWRPVNYTATDYVDWLF